MLIELTEYNFNDAIDRIFREYLKYNWSDVPEFEYYDFVSCYYDNISREEALSAVKRKLFPICAIHYREYEDGDVGFYIFGHSSNTVSMLFRKFSGCTTIMKTDNTIAIRSMELDES